MIEYPPSALKVASLSSAPAGILDLLTFRLVDLGSSLEAIQESGFGIEEHPVTGGKSVYIKTYQLPATGGEYVEVWKDTSQDPPVEAFDPDIIKITDTPGLTYVPSPTTYATSTDLISYAPETATLTEGERTAALRQAEKDLDWYAGFGGTSGNPNRRRFIPTELDLEVAEALNRAVCAQAQYRLYMGPAFFTDQVQYTEVSGDARTSMNRAGYIGPQARIEFPRQLRKLTGKMAG